MAICESLEKGGGERELRCGRRGGENVQEKLLEYGRKKLLYGYSCTV